MKTSELIGTALDWAVAKAKGYAGFVLDSNRFVDMHETGHYNYSTDWAQGGPIIERECLSLVNAKNDGVWSAYPIADNPVEKRKSGPTPLIAAMRCLVASKLGEDVSIPEELKK